MSDEAKFPSDLADRFQLRMPPGMRDQIAEAAKANNRSMNAELIARIEDSFKFQAPLSQINGKAINDIRDLGDMLIKAASAARDRGMQLSLKILEKEEENP